MSTVKFNGSAVSELSVFLASEDRHLKDVFALRYDVYVQEMGRRQQYADHARRRIEEPMDRNAHLVVAYVDNMLVGTGRVNFVRDTDIGPYHEWYKTELFEGYSPEHLAIITPSPARS